MSTAGPMRQPEHAHSPEAKTSDGFRDLQWFAYASIFVAFDIAKEFRVSGFKSFSEGPGGELPVAQFVAGLILFAAFLFLAASWIMGTRKELALWLTYLEFRQEPDKAAGIVLTLSLFLGMSLAFVGNVALITVFFTLGLLFNIGTQLYTNNEFSKALDKIEPAKKALVPPAMLEYWQQRPQAQRIVAVALVSCIACIFAKMAGKSPNHKDAFTLAAYYVLIVDLLAGEMVILSWRASRDRAIKVQAARLQAAVAHFSEAAPLEVQVSRPALPGPTCRQLLYLGC